MRTVNVKRYFCLLVVLLFIVPSVTALNSMKQNDNISNTNNNLKIEENLETNVLAIHDYIPAGMKSIEVQYVLEKYSPEEFDEPFMKFLASFNTKMLERRERFTYEFPDLPYLPLDLTKLVGKYDPETGAIESAFPNADLSSDIESFRFDTNRRSSVISSAFPSGIKTMGSTSGQSTSSTRGSRAPPEADLSVTQIEWTAVNSGWGNYFEADTSGTPPVPQPGDQYSYGGFQIGKNTRFTITITNLNPTVSASNVKVNFSVSEYYSGIPMMRTETKIITVSGVNTDVTFDFVPPFAGDISQFCTVDYEGDPDSSNNGYGWYGMPVFIWSADFESGGTNWGWQKLTDGTTIPNTDAQWTGDRGTTNYLWDKTNTPANAAKPEHTSAAAWYHGNEPGDDYEDTLPGRHINDRGNAKNNTYLETPRINMGSLIDGQEYLGELEDNTFWLPFTPMYGAMVTGELEVYEFQQGGVTYWDPTFSDWIDMRETADSPSGDNWQVKGLAYYGRVWGDYENYFGGNGDWNPSVAGFVSGTSLVTQAGYPWEVFVGDGSGGTKSGGGVRNWTQNGGPKFRLDFIGDGGGVDDNDPPGAYFDDFATWGAQDYVVEKRVGFTEFEYPKTNDVSILYEGSTASFSAKVQNYGKSQQVNVKVDIYEYDHWAASGSKLGSTPVFTQQKSGGTLGKDQESSDIIFSWSPDKAGDYKLFAEAGNYDTDWTPGDNKVEFILHVSPAESDEVDVLLVDDDDSMGGPGIARSFYGMYYINTEFKMMKALSANDDMKFRLYTVGYNETGPDYEIMSDYELVIWMTGLDNEYAAHAGRDNYSPTKKVWDVTLKEEDLTQLELFLSDPNEEKKFWLISPGFLYDKYGGSPSITGNDDFAKIYLKVDRCKANETEWNQDFSEITTQGTQNPLEGVAESIMDEVQYTTYDKPEPPYRFNDIGGWVEIGANDKITQRLFYQDESHYNYNAVQYKDKTTNDFMSTYFAFNFYLINDEDDCKDIVYRVLTGFGMTGGVIVKPYNNIDTKEIMPGQEINFRLIVTNTGKREDTMTLSVTKDSKYSDWNAWFEINGVQKSSVKIAGLSDYNKVYLHMAAPAFEDSEDYMDPRNQAGTLIGFGIKAVSGNTALESSTEVFAQLGAVGNITLTADDTEETINFNETAEFQLKLLNETNGVDTVDVRLSFKGDGNKLAQFSLKGSPKTTPEIVVTLESNIENFDVKLLVTAGEHTLTGYHNVTVEVKDDENTLLDWVDLSVKVNQFYKVKCTTDGDIDDGEVNFIIDPNNYTDDTEEIEGEQYIKTSFIINVLNFGNGFDTIALDYEENDDSEDTSDWLFGIVSVDDNEDEFDTITVGYYDENNIPKYAEEEVQFDIYIPIGVDVGTYKVDFFIEIESPNIEALTPGIDEDENNRVSFMFEVIKPNLRFIPIQPDTNVDNFEFWDYLELVPIQRDYLQNDEFYIEKKHKEFDDLSIEFKVAIDNIGDSDIDLEPSNILLQITHENDFGDKIYDANLTPNFPTNAKMISAGENATFTFLWESFDILQEQKTIVDYSFEITVDLEQKIYEKEEDDNSNTVQLTINHLKKKTSGGGSTPGFEGLIMIAAISILMVALYDYRRRQH